MDDELNIAEYVHILWRRRSLIIGVALAAILVAAVISLIVLQPAFETTALLLVSGPRFQSQTASLQTNTTPQLTVDNLIPVVHNEVVATTVASRMPGTPASTPRDLVQKVKISQVRGTNLLRVTARGPTPGAAVAIASAWSEAIVEHIDSLSLEETRRTFSLLEQKIASVAEGLAETENALRDFRANTKIPILQQRVDEIVRRVAFYEARLAETAQGGVPADGEVSLQPRGGTYTLTVTSVRDPARIRKILTALNGDLAAYQRSLATERHRETQLVRQAELARSTHQLLVEKREETRILLGANAGMVKVAVPAQLPVSPAGPRTALNLTLAGILGLIVGTMLAFVAEYLGTPVAKVPRPASGAVLRPRSEESKARS